MTALERRCRWLLRAYPAWYRRERGEEIIATLLEASPPGRNWPAPRDVRALITGGLRVRAWGNQRQSAAASLRQAVFFGVTIALLWNIAADLASEGELVILAWTHTTPWLGTNPWIFAADALALAAVAAAWFAPRRAVTVLALAAAAAQVRYQWASGITAIIEPAGLLILLAILAPGRNRLPRSWFWLACVIPVANFLDQTTGIRPLLPVYHLINPALTLVPWIILGAAVLWAAVDARPAVAMAIWITCTWPVPNLLLSWSGNVGGIVVWHQYLSAAAAAGLAAAATWRLRRQAVL